MPDNAAPVLIVTRPEAAAARLAAAFPGVETIRSPLLRIDDLCPGRPGGEFAALVLTSENGARAARRLGLDLSAFAVGARTAAAFGGATVAGPDAEALIAHLLGAGVAGPLLHVRGRHAVTDLARRLTALGIPTQDIVAYDQVACPLTDAARAALTGTRPVVLPVFSPRSAALVAAAGPFAAAIHAVAISAAAAAPLAGLRPATLTIAETPDGPAMTRAIAAAIARLTAG